MSFTQKIYYNNKPLILEAGNNGQNTYPGYTVLQGASAAHYRQAIQLMERYDCTGVVVRDSSRENLEKELLWAFYPIHSGGGVVVNEQGDVLMIYRRNKWDLPKGKQDEGEDIETCALREVSEETGLKQVSIRHRIGNSMHIYPMNNQMVLKYTTWFLMDGSASEQLFPQEEEHIEQVVWVKPSEIPALLSNSFDTITDVLKEARIL